MPTDPVCNMDVGRADAAGTAEYQGTTYYFCAEGCKNAFEAEPGEYV